MCKGVNVSGVNVAVPGCTSKYQCELDIDSRIIINSDAIKVHGHLSIKY